MDKLYPFKDGEAEGIVHSIGGTVTEFRYKGSNVFYPFMEINGKNRGGCPICAPWFGESSRGAKKHGFLRDLEAEYVSAYANSVDMKFNNDPTGNYPWKIHYYTNAVIQENILRIKLEMVRPKNGIPDTDPPPILPAFHPYFACHDATKVDILVGRERFSWPEKTIKIPAGKMGDSILIEIPGSKRVQMKLSRSFFEYGGSWLNIWTDAPRRYICVEPVLYDPRRFDTPYGVFLKGWEPVVLSVSFRVL